MQGRHLTKSLALVSLLSPATPQALTIGDIEINSGLNQQLNAEIPLNLDPDETPGSLKIKMASASSFAANQIRWHDSLSKIQVTRIGSTVKISSKSRITDPDLDFLLEINTPQGPQFRHYKIVFDHQASRNEILTNSVEPPKTVKASKIEAPVIDTAPVVLPNYEQRINADKHQFGPIQKTDNLWQIASHLAKSHGVSNKKMLAGLRDSNPDAFNNLNKGSLKTGAYLQIPDFKNPVKAEVETKIEAAKVIETKAVETPAIPQATPTPTTPTVPTIDTAQLQTRIETLEHQVEQLQKDLALLKTPQTTTPSVLAAPEPEVVEQAPVIVEPAPILETETIPVEADYTNLERIYISVATGLGVSLIGFLAWLGLRKTKAKPVPAPVPAPVQETTEIGPTPTPEQTVTKIEDELELNMDNLQLSADEEDLMADMDVYMAHGQNRVSEQPPEPEPEEVKEEETPEPEIVPIAVDELPTDIDISPGNDNSLNDQAIDDFEFDFDFEDSRRPSKKAKAFKNELDQARYERTENKSKK